MTNKPKKAPVDKLSLLDEKLIEAASNRWTAEQIEERYGVEAPVAIARIKEILRSQDIWSEIEQRKLLLNSAYKLKERAEKALDISDPRGAETAMKIIKTIDDMMNNASQISEEEFKRAAEAQAIAIISIIERSYERARQYLIEEYGSLIKVEEVDAVFSRAMKEITAEEQDD